MQKIQNIPERLQQPIADVINNAIVETFLTVFDVPVIGVEKILLHDLSNEDLACEVKLTEKDAEVDVIFFFAKPLVQSILDGVYAKEDLKHTSEAYDDAACEIANIVCAHLKAFLNQKGFDLKMQLPYTLENANRESMNPRAINLYFTLNEDKQNLLVNVQMFQNDK